MNFQSSSTTQSIDLPQVRGSFEPNRSAFGNSPQRHSKTTLRCFKCGGTGIINNNNCSSCIAGYITDEHPMCILLNQLLKRKLQNAFEQKKYKQTTQHSEICYNCKKQAGTWNCLSCREKRYVYILCCKCYNKRQTIHPHDQFIEKAHSDKQQSIGRKSIGSDQEQNQSVIRQNQINPISIKYHQDIDQLSDAEDLVDLQQVKNSKQIVKMDIQEPSNQIKQTQSQAGSIQNHSRRSSFSYNESSSDEVFENQNKQNPVQNQKIQQIRCGQCKRSIHGQCYEQCQQCKQKKFILCGECSEKNPPHKKIHKKFKVILYKPVHEKGLDEQDSNQYSDTNSIKDFKQDKKQQKQQKGQQKELFPTYLLTPNIRKSQEPISKPITAKNIKVNFAPNPRRSEGMGVGFMLHKNKAFDIIQTKKQQSMSQQSNKSQVNSEISNEPQPTDYKFSNYQCDYCKQVPCKVRYHCRKCPDFDLCWKCFKQRRTQHKHNNWKKIDYKLIEQMNKKQLRQTKQQLKTLAYKSLGRK